ncbi:MAG: FG-GAP-like repeat-containing protein, partial [bacterium]
YSNDGNGGFSEISANLTGLWKGDAAFGDIDGDDDLDVLITGLDINGQRQTKIYRNDLGNTPPQPPGLHPRPGIPIVRPNSVRFSWLPGSDSETPQNGLAYALRVGTYPGGANILAPPSLANGRRKMAGLEQTIRDTTWTLSLPPGRILKPGIYYWSVQTIDEAFAGSAFSAERTFVINPNLRYTDDALTLAPHHRGDFDLGDYDNDGDLDLLLTGELSFPMAPHTGLYRNDGFNAGAGWSFNEVSTGMPGVAYGGIAWGDYDADGDLDVVLTGSTATRFTPLTKIYRNDAGAFTDINAPLTPLVLGDAAWGDFDNDGDLDLIITGTDSTGSEANAATKLYRNDGHDRFAEMPAGSSPNPGFTIPGVSRSSLAWSDYDADGDLDLLLTGRRRNGGLVQDITRLYRNDGTAFASGQNYWKFIDINAGLPGFNVDQFDQRASVSWGDYDADGDPDLLLFGKLDPGDFSLKPKVFRNDGPSGNNWRFTEIQTPDLLEYFSVRPQAWSAAWGDYDHDGDLDALLSRWDVILTAPGFETVFGASEIYENINGDFYDRVWLETTHQEQPTGIGGSAIFADFDGNHRLDVLAMGYLDGGISTPFTYRIFRDTGPGNNNPPAAPSGLSQTISGDTITFHWNATNDDHTSRNGLTYNLHIQRSNAGPGVMPSMSDPSTGYRRVVRSGNAGSRTSWSIQNPPPGNYTWGVQAIDHEFIGSPFTMGNFIQPLGRNRTLLPGFWYSDAEWADYDNDGDLDVALMGQHQSAAPANMTKVLRNDGADNFGNPIFTDINAPLIGARLGSIAWGDYDNDHYPDLLLTGTIESQPLRLSKLYHNNQGSSFTEVALGLPGVKFGGGEWGDYDLDGDLDFILFGDTEGQRGYTQLFRNDGAGGPAGWRFTPDTLQTQSLLVEGGPVRLSSGAVAWGDCDNDGDLDLLMVGTHAGSQQISTVFLNEGLFANLHSNLEPLAGIFVNAAWGDYDNDGDLDILLKGMSNNVGVGPISKIYRNDGNVFSAAAILEYRYQGGAAWGDYDNDGDLDVVTNGRTLHLTPPLYPLIYRNDQQAFVRDTVAAAILRDNDRWNGTGFGDVAWADYDNDHDLDLLAAGWFEVAFNRTAPATFIYENGHAPGQANTPPTTPTNLRAIASEATIMTLIWNAATDQQTPAAGLTYNLRVGTTPGGAEIISPHSRPDGYRQLAQLGNTNHATQRPLLRLTPGRTYYWSVQAVDHNFAGSPFAPEQQFVAGVSTSVHEPANALPKAYSLSQNWPNPFNPVTSVQYAVISEQFVSLKVYDVMGKEVATLLNAKQPAGYYRVTFDGRGLASGVYLLHLRAGSFVATRKMLLTK